MSKRFSLSAILSAATLVLSQAGFAAHAQEVIVPEALTAPVGDLADAPVFYPEAETNLGSGWPTDPCRDYCGDSNWFVLTEALWLEHDGDPADMNVAVHSRLQQSLLSTNDLELGSAIATRVTLGLKLSEFSMFESVFNGEHHWSDRDTVIEPNRVSLPGPLGRGPNDFNRADLAEIAYSSRFNNVELNYYRSLGDLYGCYPGLAVLVGFRYIDLDEDFAVNAFNINVGSSTYQVDTENEMFGGQAGLRLQHMHGSFRWEVNGKAGVFNDNASQATLLTGAGGAAILRNTGVNSDRTAFVGEFNFALSWQLTSIWGIRTGYTIIWLEDISIAPDQLDFSNTPFSGSNLADGGHLVLHGASVGIYARW